MSEVKSPLITLTAISMSILALASVGVMSGIIPGVFSAKPAVEEVAKACPHCGVIESIQLVETMGEATGAAIGGLTDAAIGNQSGAGRGKTVATAAGAAGGAYAGNEAKKISPIYYRIYVRMSDGNIVTVTQKSESGFKPGDPVKLADNTLAGI